jgi:hypothetical protein
LLELFVEVFEGRVTGLFFILFFGFGVVKFRETLVFFRLISAFLLLFHEFFSKDLIEKGFIVNSHGHHLDFLKLVVSFNFGLGLPFRI